MKKDVVLLIVSLTAAAIFAVWGCIALSPSCSDKIAIPASSDAVSSSDGRSASSTDAQAAKCCVNIYAGSAAVRSGAGESFESIGSVVQNQYFACIGQTEAEGTTWYEIKFGDKTGFVPSAAAKRIEEMPKSDNRYINDIAERYGVMGMQVAVIDCGTLTHTYEYGYAQYCVREMRADTKIRCASISKVVLAMAAMRMREEGTVDLDEDIGAYWGFDMRSPTFPNEVISLRSIFSHRSGIGELGYQTDVRLQLRSGVFTKERPNQDWRYCNYAIGVAGSTLEAAAQISVPDYIGKKLLAPMGISAAYSGSSFGADDIAELYRSDHSTARSIDEQISAGYSSEPCSHTAVFAGGLMISAADLARLTAVLANDGVYGSARLLAKDSVELIEQRQFLRTDENGSTFFQCLPLRYQNVMYDKRGLYYHTGNAYGVLALMSYDPVTKDGVVVITTGANVSRDRYGVYAVCGEVTDYVYSDLLS